MQLMETKKVWYRKTDHSLRCFTLMDVLQTSLIYWCKRMRFYFCSSSMTKICSENPNLALNSSFWPVMKNFHWQISKPWTIFRMSENYSKEWWSSLHRVSHQRSDRARRLLCSQFSAYVSSDISWLCGCSCVVSLLGDGRKEPAAMGCT